MLNWAGYTETWNNNNIIFKRNILNKTTRIEVSKLHIFIVFDQTVFLSRFLLSFRKRPSTAADPGLFKRKARLVKSES